MALNFDLKVQITTRWKLCKVCVGKMREGLLPEAERNYKLT
jgi:hypothetical protein